MEFLLLGPVEISDGSSPVALGGPKQRLVLVHLLLRANQLVTTDRLIDAVWGEEPPAAARNTLQVYVSHLRKSLGPGRLEGRSGGYVLRVDPSSIDSVRFEALVNEGRALVDTDPAAAVRILHEALEQWRGPALDDLAHHTSLQPEISRLEELRLAATEECLGAELDLGRHRELVPELETLVGLQPLRERLWEHLMCALYRSGRQADALDAYQRARTLLADELGIDPSPELQRLEEQVLRQDPILELHGEPLRGYRLLEKIGAGSFGSVHRAFQPQVGREVAIKVIHPRFANNPGFIRRFEAETQMVARLEHPHIVPLYDFWREPDGAYQVMRYLRGGSLREALCKAPLPLERAVRLLDQIAVAISVAHRHGVVHRDVKPANILLDEDGNAYLSDFGIAKDLVLAELGGPGSGPNALAYYLSPEEILGQPATPRTDIYGLGLILYEVLAGCHPFAQNHADEIVDKHLQEPIPSLVATRPDVPDAVDEVIGKATAKDPGERYSDASALAAAFRAALLPRRAPPVPAARAEMLNPYKGLRPFLEADANDFFGREAFVDRVVDRLREEGEGSRFLAVVGPSGCGKSSLVRAGLIPAVRRGALPGSGRWFVVEMHPGAEPFKKLEAALLRIAVKPPAELGERLEWGNAGRLIKEMLPADSEFLLVIDQFEELFTLADDELQRVRFLEQLVAATTTPGSRMRIVATLRADFYDRPLSYRGFGDLLAARNEAVTPLSVGELRRAISGPAERFGITVDPSLMTDMVADVVTQPGALPLLQYALTELYDLRRDSSLTADAYHKIGGVSGALVRRAENIYGALNDAGREATRQLFLRLVTLGQDGSEDARRRVLHVELTSLQGNRDAMEEVIETFGARRLLSFDRDPVTRGPTVGLAHEALLGQWGRLRGWIEAARDDMRTHRRLAAASGEWTAAGRDASFLLRGTRLAQFEAWAATSGLAFTTDERAYLEASRAQRDRELAEEESRTEREAALERRSLARMRALVAVLSVAALVAAGLAGIASSQRNRAEREAGLASFQRTRAERERRVAVAREVAAASVANLEVDPERSILLALEAIERTRSSDGSALPEAEEALHQAVQASRIIMSIPGVGGSIDWGKRDIFVTAGAEGTGMIDIRRISTRESVRKIDGHDSDVNDVVFSNHGAMLATTGDDGKLKVWDASTSEILMTGRGHGEARGPSFSPDGTLVAAAWEGGVKIWDVSKKQIIEEIDTSLAAGPFRATTSFSPDGKRLGISPVYPPSADDGVGDGLVVELATGLELFTIRDKLGVSNLEWSPNGKWIATSPNLDSAKIWDAGTGRLRFTLSVPIGVRDVDWSPDSRHLVTANGRTATATVWEITAARARELFTLSGSDMRSGVARVVFSPDGDRVMTGNLAGTAVNIWDVTPSGDAEWAHIPFNSFGRLDKAGVAFTPNGQGVVANAGDGKAMLLQPETGKRLRTFGPHGPAGRDGVDAAVLDVEVSPNGELVATAGNDWNLRLWDLATGEELTAILHSDSVMDAGWDPSGNLLATTDAEQRVSILDQSWSEVKVLRRASAISFSPDGRLLATVSGNVRIWDVARWEVVQTIPARGDVMAFDPIGARIATAAELGRVQVRAVDDGGLVATLPSNSGQVVDVVYSPDGSTIATAGADTVVRLWDAESSEQILVLRGHKRSVHAVAFSPDGSKLASQSSNGTVRIWALDLDDLIDIANENLTRGLADEECRQYLHVDSCS